MLGASGCWARVGVGLGFLREWVRVRVGCNRGFDTVFCASEGWVRVGVGCEWGLDIVFYAREGWARVRVGCKLRRMMAVSIWSDSKLLFF